MTPYDYVLMFDGDEVQTWSSIVSISMFNTHTSPDSFTASLERKILFGQFRIYNECVSTPRRLFLCWLNKNTPELSMQNIHIDWYFTASWRHWKFSVWTVTDIYFNFHRYSKRVFVFSICPCVPSVSSAQFLFCFTLLAGHLLTAAVLQLFAFIIMRSHFKQPAALYLDHLQWTGVEREINELCSYCNHSTNFLFSLPPHSH